MISVPLLFSVAGGPDIGLIAVFGAATAFGGLFVTMLAYRGYRRNESRPMLYLAAGILFLTTIPIGIEYTLLGVTTATDAEILLAITTSHFAGVAAILFALTKA